VPPGAIVRAFAHRKGTAFECFPRRPPVNSARSSTLVTNNSAANPVGLLFAGNSSGKYAIANPIGAVLSQLGVTIDGK
jgi:hypothetical protein